MLFTRLAKPWSTMVGMIMIISLGNGISVNHDWPWFGKAFKTLINHRFVKWHLCQPQVTIVWLSFPKPQSAMVNQRFRKWHLSQPWLTTVWLLKIFFNHGQPYVKWHLCQPWLTMVWLSSSKLQLTMVNPRFVKWNPHQQRKYILVTKTWVLHRYFS